ncbi:hypothetical protein C8R43DRAFT_947367 [Mycena crocata]|nr:hypothetical protein C8R43DRAFT_947367 [Mycena crocata]
MVLRQTHKCGYAFVYGCSLTLGLRRVGTQWLGDLALYYSPAIIFAETLCQTSKHSFRYRLPSPWSYPVVKGKYIADWFPTFSEDVLPTHYFCDWTNYTGSSFFLVPREWHNTSVAMVLFTHTFKIPGTLRPLAFSDAPDPIVLVAADSGYFLWNGDTLRLTRYGSDSASGEDFLAQITERGGIIDYLGLRKGLPQEYVENYHRVDTEGRRLEWVAAGRLDRDPSFFKLFNPTVERRVYPV